MRHAQIGLLFVLLAAAGVVAQGAAPADRVSGSVLVYGIQTPNFGESDLCVMRPDGSGQRRLTRGPGGDSQPSISPNGKTIAFTRTPPHNGSGYEGQIHVVNADGRGRRKLTEELEFFGNDRNPAWSPDGETLAYSFLYARSDYAGRIMVMSTNDPQPVDLGYGIQPSWSPDGRQIVFSSGSDYDSGLRVMSSDGGGRRVLTRSGGNPAWSPDGSRILFVDAPTNPRSFPKIYSIASDGSDLRQLTTNGGIDSDPAWSPDGSMIAFVRDVDRRGSGDIFLMRPDGSDQRRVTRTAHSEINPTWQRSGMAFGLAPRQACAPSLVGTPGRDRLRGTVGEDSIHGLAGDDLLVGRGAYDYLSGGPGSDRIDARDGRRDIVLCGPGRDRVTADRRDRVARDCERISRR